MPNAVITRKLIGDVALKFDRTVNGPAGREEQMVVLGKINHRANVERGAGVGKIGLILGLMIDFHADEDIG